jgi:hypothetical protein
MKVGGMESLVLVGLVLASVGFPSGVADSEDPPFHITGEIKCTTDYSISTVTGTLGVQEVTVQVGVVETRINLPSSSTRQVTQVWNYVSCAREIVDTLEEAVACAETIFAQAPEPRQITNALIGCYYGI